MADKYITVNEDEFTSALGRLYEARWALVSVALIIVCGVVFYDIAFIEAIGGFILVIAASAVVPRRRRILRTKQAAVRRKMIWPDASAQMFVNAFPEAALILDASGVVRYINDRASQIVSDVSRGDPVTFKFRNPAFVNAVSHVLQHKVPFTVSHAITQGVQRDFLIHLVPVSGESGRADFILMVLNDTTEHMRVQSMRSDFIANVSHELRTPIASLSGFIETLQGAAKEDPVNRERFLSIMYEQTQRMTRLVNDLLSLSRMEMYSHKLPSKQIDLASVVGHVVDVLTPLAKENGIEFHVEIAEEPSFVLGEHDELVQLVQNLVENACKYGESGERIDITLAKVAPPLDGPYKMGEQCYKLIVRDYGPGISEEHLPRLTERFYRVDVETSRKKMGTGLGLALVKHTLARHRGHLSVSSTLGEGAIFCVYMTAIDK